MRAILILIDRIVTVSGENVYQWVSKASSNYASEASSHKLLCIVQNYCASSILADLILIIGIDLLCHDEDGVWSSVMEFF